MRIRSMLHLMLCLLVPFIVGSIAGVITSREIPGWYAGLSKPSFNPPNGVFAPVWTVLYLLMGISLFRVLRLREGRSAALTIFSVQLALNFLWSIVFFGMHRPDAALAVILALWTCILLMIFVFYRVDRTSGLLQIPYLAWVSFATLLNAAVWYLN